MTALWTHSALELARMIHASEVSSREVVESHLARIDEVNPHLNAVVRRFDDQALAAADAADHAVGRGNKNLGPLHGVPYTVKENIDLAGTPTTQGVPMLADAVSHVDAPTVGRMRAAGAIPIGRTNLPDLGLRVHTHSTLHGLTKNPWHPGRTAGGSSGGEASAIASGMSPIGIGNDIGGSLRNPAHCCGIASIKPTVGVVPMATVIPPQDMTLSSQQMVAEGPMARRVADVRLGLQVMAGPDVRDPRTAPVHLTALGDGQRVTVAILADPPGGNTHPEISAAVRSAADILSNAGHNIIEATPPGYEETIDLWGALLAGDIAVNRPMLDMVMGDDGKRLLDNLLDATGVITMETSVALQANRFRLLREWGEFFLKHQVIVSPTWGMPAFEHDADLDDADALLRDTLRPVLPANFLGLPAAVVPHGTADNLPVGIQVIGDRFTDLRCLDIAAQIEAATGILTPIDPRL
jgi:amidase